MTSKPERSNTNQCQRKRILTWLRNGPLTTYQARGELDIFSPAARVLELRAAGYNIETHWTTVNTGPADHKIAQYVLFAESKG